MHQVTVTQTAHAAAVPSIGGVGGFVLQDDVTVITTHTGAVITVTGTRSQLNGADVTEDAPAGDHTAIVAYWQGEAKRWAAPAARLATRDHVEVDDDPVPDPPAPAGRKVIQVTSFEVDDVTVTAPGFEREQFLTFVARAREAQLRTTPAGTPGTVMVQSGSSPASYAVTRQECACQGHQRVGRCYHRAYAIWLADVAGVDILKVPTIGVSKRGLPLTFGRKPAVKAVAS